MLMNLRKAHQLRSLAEARQVTLGNPEFIAIPVLATDVDRRVTEALEKAQAEQAQADELESVIKNIRTLVDKANFESGVNELLAEQGSLNRKLARLVRISTQTAETRDDLKAKIEFAKIPSESRYHTRESHVNWVAVTPEQIKAAEAEEVKVRRRLRAISEDLMSKNFTTQIMVSDADITVLEKHNVV
jgi:hypothetical protein